MWKCHTETYLYSYLKKTKMPFFKNEDRKVKQVLIRDCYQYKDKERV
jgi:hypothetical protein